MKPSQPIFLIAMCVAILCGCSHAAGRWTAPKNPNPGAILDSTRADIASGHYADALAKHVWFHDNVLKIDESFRGVRLSFALSDWMTLGNAYPPALAALKSIRDADEKQIRGSAPEWQLFADFVAINKYLDATNRTSDAFIWLDANNPTFAAKVFDLAEASLVVAKEYRLCGKYLNAKTSFERDVNEYHRNQKLNSEQQSKDPAHAAIFKDYMEHRFSNQTTTLIALLVLNGQKPAATSIASQALTEWNNPDFAKLLDNAKKGEIPAPWP